MVLEMFDSSIWFIRPYSRVINKNTWENNKEKPEKINVGEFSVLLFFCGEFRIVSFSLQREQIQAASAISAILFIMICSVLLFCVSFLKNFRQNCGFSGE